MSAREFEAARLLGDRLRARRTALGLSQDDVAHLSGVDLTNYGKLERGIGEPQTPVRIYAPVGSHKELLAYLVRRLLENGANSSFVNRIADDAVPVEALVRDAVAELEALDPFRNPMIPLPTEIFGHDRHNSAGVVLRALGRLDDALAQHRVELALQRELVAREPRNTRWQQYLGVAQNYVGTLMDARGNHTEAMKFLRSALATFEQLEARDKANLTWRREVGRAYFWLGYARFTAGAADVLGDLNRAVDVLESIATHAAMTVHVRLLAGRDPHHIVEAQFKAFARALRAAVALDPRVEGIPSTKGAL